MRKLSYLLLGLTLACAAPKTEEDTEASTDSLDQASTTQDSLDSSLPTLEKKLIEQGMVDITAVIPGIQVDGIFSAVMVAVVMALLNRFVKPVIELLTLPISFLTLGLFYLVINVLMVYLADWIVSPGFRVEGFIAALLFSLALSVVNSLLDAMAGD